jgi:Ca-activated chloride channel family protein
VVEVTLTVRDERGNLVSDLDASDFVVREDGRAQPLQVFAPAAAPAEREELALNLGMLFDTSESMRKELRLSQESAIRFLDSIPRARDLVLIFFDQDIRISRYNSENQQGIFERILDTKSGGNTALFDAIAIYLSRVAETAGRKVLVVFTDGDDTTSRLRAEEVVRLVRSNAVTIYPVAFGGQHAPGSVERMRARAFLNELAASSGGQIFQPSASKELAGIYQKILDELGSQYVLGYVSDNPARDGKLRRLTVEVKRPGLRVRHRPGYYAPKDEPPKPVKR